MLEADNLFTVVALASVALAAVLAVSLMAISTAHIALAGLRAAQGRPARFEGWTAARLFVALAGLTTLAASRVVSGWASPVMEFSGLFLAVCAPLLLVLYKIRVVDMEKPVNQDGPRRLGLAAKNLLYICGLPGLMTGLVMAGLALDGAGNYYLLPRPTQCSEALRATAPIDLPETGPRHADHVVPAAEFWLDTTLNALTFSAFDTSGCYIRRVDYNRENLRMVATVASYNLILLFVVSTIIYSVFQQKVRKKVAKVTSGA